MNEFKQALFGNIPIGLYFACVFFAMLGVFLVLLMGTQLRNKTADNKFSWSYLWNDNLKRILANILAILVTLRFMPEIVGKDLTPFTGFCVGLAWDSILLFIKQKTSWLDPKPKE